MAICGMACRLPGGVNSPSELWDFLYNIDAYSSSTGKNGTTRTQHGYFLADDLHGFDASFFFMLPNDIASCDPQQRRMLEVARDYIVDAGEIDWRGEAVGVFMGSSGGDWEEMLESDPQQYGAYRVLGASDFSLANRVAYEMGLKGPRYSSLDAACTAIVSGECKSAIVGGSSLIMTPSMSAKMDGMGVLSLDGSCKTFSADANGYVRAEAINAVYIKPLADALRDRTPVRAVLRATAVNHNGKSAGIASPNTEAQRALIKHTYKLAGIADADVCQTGFFECHGTGIVAGDTAETKAIAQVFSGAGVYIGSIKANVGHSGGPSGLTSLIKGVLALENEVIPPQIKFTTPNPNIPFAEGKLIVLVEKLPWPKDRLARISVNSFGVGGTNAHAILDSASSHNARQELLETSYSPQLLLYSANSASALDQAVQDYEAYLHKCPDRIADLAYTLATRREHLQHRAFLVANRDQIGRASPAVAAQHGLKIVLVFTGQGAQWPSMGRDLFRENPVFRDSIKELDRCLSLVSDEAPQWKIEQELRKPAKTSRLGEAKLAQPICTAIQIALVDTLASFGIRVDTVIGHSSGEIAAAYSAGALTAGEAITAAFYRGCAADGQKRAGSMAAFLVPNVTIACDNSPRSVTISGDSDQVEQVLRNISQARPEALTRLLQVNKAYHSYHMSEISDRYEDMITSRMQTNRSRKPFFSSVTGDILAEDTALDAGYWRCNLECPVMFRLSQHALGQKAVYVEVGPHSALAGPLLQIMAATGNTSFQYVATMIRGQRCTDTLLAAVGKMHCLGVPVNFGSLYPSDHYSCLTGLPRYPFDHANSYWHETRLTNQWRHAQHRHHDLLGSRTRESTDLEPAWRNLFHLDNAPWVRDHRVEDEIVFPFAAYVGMAAEAARQTSGAAHGVRIRNLLVRTAMVVTEDHPTELVTNLGPSSSSGQWWRFSISSFNDGVWTKHCTGEISPLDAIVGSAREYGELPRQLSSRKWYTAVRSLGVDYGHYFQGLSDIRTSTRSPERASATIKNHASRDSSDSDYHLHPTILDAALQLLSCAAALGHTRHCSKVLATSIDELEISRCQSDVECSVTASVFGKGSVVGSGEATVGREVCLRMKGARLRLLGENKTDNKDAAARCVWAPHIDFLSEDKLLSAPAFRCEAVEGLAQLGNLAIVYLQRAIETADVVLPSHRRFTNWIEAAASLVQSSGLEYTENEDAAQKMRSLAESLRDSSAGDAAKAVLTVAMSTPKAISEKTNLVEILYKGDILESFRDFLNVSDMSLMMQHLKHLRPNIRVLELGAGAGTATQRILEHLDGLYSKYTFSDTSRSLFPVAQDKFRHAKNIDFEVLDIGADLASQGFDGREYDIIIATNVVHRTANVAECLRNINTLLAPDGRIILQEIDPSCHWAYLVLSLDTDFMSNPTDGRPEGMPYYTMDDWEAQLVNAGFLTPQFATSDGAKHTLIARKRMQDPRAKQVTLLCVEKDSDVDEIAQSLSQRGYQCVLRSFEEDPEPGTDVISLLDKDRPFLDSMTSTTYGRFQAILERISGNSLVWLTHSSPIDCNDPRYTQIFGASRALRHSTSPGIRFSVIQSDCGFHDMKIIDIFERIRLEEAQQPGFMLPECEYALLNGQVMVSRWLPVDLAEELAVREESDTARLHLIKNGIQAELGWAWGVVPALREDDVEVEIHTSSLNETDVAMATELDESVQPGFGNQGAGIISRVGSNVKDLKVGDRVILYSSGTLSLLTTVPAILCAKIPTELGFEEASIMGRAYVEAMYSLVYVGNLQPGQSVLIHDACSEVGNAAVQIALRIGAQIFTTVDVDSKANFLHANFSIALSNIFSSTDSFFADAIRRATKGRGVDLVLVLNSLPDQRLQSSWQCVAEFGKLVDTRRKKTVERSDLDITSNRSYCSVDIGRLEYQRPELVNRLLRSAVDHYSQGFIRPNVAIKIFDGRQVQDALGLGAQAVNVVVSLRAPDQSPQIGRDFIQRKNPVEFDSAASYLLVGGLGGIGRAVAVWMAEKGARHFIFLGRSAGHHPEHLTLTRDLNSLGCTVTMVKGDVTDVADVTRAIQAAGEAPLKCLLQMSMVLRDRVWENMTWTDWQESRVSKIQGTWNLHTLLGNTPLDFFVVFSSISGIVGNASQANYGSANTYMEGLCQYRRSIGLKASAINVGIVLGMGAIAENEDLSHRMKGMGMDEATILDALAVAVNMPSDKSMPIAGLTDPCSITLGLAPLGPVKLEEKHSYWRMEPRMAAFRITASTGADSGEARGDGLEALLSSARQDPSVLKDGEATHTLASAIGLKVLSLLFRPEADLEAIIKSGLSDVGMDSLVAMEMRSWWKQTFGIDIKVLDMLRMGNLEVLAK
ncbi:acyl transferase domain-containing protein [Xylariaceae sp. AK1471]|nr:acyl transferase domain-containing protein [Xylariaceae sp. AK1471]